MVSINQRSLLRPLTIKDVHLLTRFLENLSVSTRRLSVFDRYDLVGAQAICDAIGRFDKFRMVLEDPEDQVLLGLLEFSFGIVAYDYQRYRRYGIHLDEQTDCRFGITVADAYHHRGLGTLAMPHMIAIARIAGKRRIILWGGVLIDNHSAISFYTKLGFQSLGMFGADTQKSLDMILDI